MNEKQTIRRKFQLSLVAALLSVLCVSFAQDQPAERPVFKPDRVTFVAFHEATDPKTSEPTIIVELRFMDRGNALRRLHVGETFDRFTLTSFRIRPKKNDTEEPDLIVEVDLRIDATKENCTLQIGRIYNIRLQIR